jgi:predicted nucleic acid-binding protein
VLVTERYLLDTSAVLTLTDQEDGFEKVEELLDRAAEGSAEVEVSAVSLMEMYYITLQEQGEDRAAHIVSLVKAWPVHWVYPDERMLLVAGRFKAFHRLSFADAVIAGAAQQREAVLVHKDPELETLTGEIALLTLPYKRAR